MAMYTTVEIEERAGGYEWMLIVKEDEYQHHYDIYEYKKKDGKWRLNYEDTRICGTTNEIVYDWYDKLLDWADDDKEYERLKAEMEACE